MINMGAVNCNNIAAAAVVSLFANTYITVVDDKQIAASTLPTVSSILKLRLYITKTAAARSALKPTILIAPQGINLINKPPKLQQIDARAIYRGPKRSLSLVDIVKFFLLIERLSQHSNTTFNILELNFDRSSVLMYIV